MMAPAAAAAPSFFRHAGRVAWLAGSPDARQEHATAARVNAWRRHAQPTIATATDTEDAAMRAFRSGMMRACVRGSPHVAAQQAIQQAPRRAARRRIQGAPGATRVRATGSELSDPGQRAFPQRTRSSRPHKGAQHTLSAGKAARAQRATTGGHTPERARTRKPAALARVRRRRRGAAACRVRDAHTALPPSRRQPTLRRSRRCAVGARRRAGTPSPPPRGVPWQPPQRGVTPRVCRRALHCSLRERVRARPMAAAVVPQPWPPSARAARGSTARRAAQRRAASAHSTASAARRAAVACSGARILMRSRGFPARLRRARAAPTRRAAVWRQQARARTLLMLRGTRRSVRDRRRTEGASC
jgi:hypothetical protein